MNKVSTILTAAILILAGIVVGILMFSGSKPAQYTIQNGVLNISGMYGEKVNINNISSLELKDTVPEIITRTNGSAIGTMDKGYFKLNDIGDAKLFIDKSKPPFIYIKTDSKTIILNCKDSKQTEELYSKLDDAWKNK